MNYYVVDDGADAPDKKKARANCFTRTGPKHLSLFWDLPLTTDKDQTIAALDIVKVRIATQHTVTIDHAESEVKSSFTMPMQTSFMNVPVAMNNAQIPNFSAITMRDTDGLRVTSVKKSVVKPKQAPKPKLTPDEKESGKGDAAKYEAVIQLVKQVINQSVSEQSVSHAIRQSVI